MYFKIEPDPSQAMNLFTLFNHVVTPRPVALLSTVDTDGESNLAPFSWYMMASLIPPVLIVSVGPKPDGSEKDTIRNIRDTGEFVVSVVNESILEKAIKCGAMIPSNESEFDLSGLTPTMSKNVKAFSVEESPISIECKLRQIMPIGEGPVVSNLVLGDIVGIEVADWLEPTEGGELSAEKLRAVGHATLNQYVVLKNFVEVAPQ